MPNTSCRLTVHTASRQAPAGVDLVLPADVPLGELVPPIVETVLGEAAPLRHWYLTRIAGAALDPSMSLRENQIEDGDIVVLDTVPLPRPRHLPAQAGSVVAAGADSGSPALVRAAALAAAGTGIAVSAAALVRAGLVAPNGHHVWAAAALSAAAAVAAAVVIPRDRPSSLMMGAAAVAFATATAVLAVPGAGWAATTLLASSAGLAMAVAVQRATGGDGLLTALTAACTPVAAGAAVCVMVTPRAEVGAAVLAVSALAALSLAPSMSAWTTGLTPSQPEVDESRTVAAHRRLTALVAGWSAAAALGAVVVTYTAPPVLGAVFAATIGLALLLRQRTHVDGRRRLALALAGAVSAGAALVVTATSDPVHGWWWCASAAAACAAAAVVSSRPWQPNPLAGRGIQLVEYVTLAAVVPLACWMTGILGLVREMSLP